MYLISMYQFETIAASMHNNNKLVEQTVYYELIIMFKNYFKKTKKSTHVLPLHLPRSQAIKTLVYI